MIKVSLNDAAAMLKVHPRTILRTLEDDVNAKWVEDFNPAVYLEDIADVFDCDLDVLKRVKKNLDELLSQKEALTELKIARRTFYGRSYKAAINRVNLVRYSRHNLINEHVNRF